ncbi:MAG: DNA-directed RNA polymerase subunit omega [Saprospiraceae bacterium]
MNDIKTLAQGVFNDTTPRDISRMIQDTDNIYLTLAIIAKRASQISKQLKEELHSKLEEFASSSETLEEVNENKEQIEISKFYERLPSPVLLAINEFLEDKIHYHFKETTDEEDRRAAKPYRTGGGGKRY